MNYLPDAKALVYNEIYFISVAVAKGQARVHVDLDRLYDEVSAEIREMYFGEISQAETDWNFVPSVPCSGLEIGY